MLVLAGDNVVEIMNGQAAGTASTHFPLAAYPYRTTKVRGTLQIHSSCRLWWTRLA